MTSEPKIVPAKPADASSTNVVALPHRPEPTTPSEKALGFVKEHPVLTVVGGVAAGLAISALIPRSFSRKLVRRAFGFAEAGATATLALGQETLDKAEDGGVVARKKAKVLAAQAEKLGERAAARAEKLSEKAAARAEKLSAKALDTASVLGHAAADRAERLGHLAASRAEDFGERASDRLSEFGDKALARSTKLFGHAKDVEEGLANRLLDKAHDVKARIRA